MVDADLNVTLIDYGTAQSIGLDETAGALNEEYPVGDLNYAAPEYLKGNRATLTSDLFSLGVTVYEMLTGHLPYKPVNASNPRSVNRGEYISARLFRPDVPDWLDAVLKKACHPSSGARYQALSEFSQDLNAPNPSLLKRQHHLPLMEKHPLGFWKGLCVVLLFIVLIQFGFLLT